MSAHEIADEVERQIAVAMGFSDVTVHVEPYAGPRSDQPPGTDSG